MSDNTREILLEKFYPDLIDLSDYVFQEDSYNIGYYECMLSGSMEKQVMLVQYLGKVFHNNLLNGKSRIKWRGHFYLVNHLTLKTRVYMENKHTNSSMHDSAYLRFKLLKPLKS